MFQNSDAGDGLYPYPHPQEKTCILVCSTFCVILKPHMKSQVVAKDTL